MLTNTQSNQSEIYPRRARPKHPAHRPLSVFLSAFLLYGLFLCSGCSHAYTPAPFVFDANSLDWRENLHAHVTTLGYADDVAAGLIARVQDWRDRQSRPCLSYWQQRLACQQNDRREADPSRNELSQTQYHIAERLVRQLRKHIRHHPRRFALHDVLEHGEGQCLAYAQLFWILGRSIGLDVTALNVLETNDAQSLPSGEGHVACMIHLADGSTALFDPVPHGGQSAPFDLHTLYVEEGVSLRLRDGRTGRNLWPCMQRLDDQGLRAQLANSQGAEHYRAGHTAAALTRFNEALRYHPHCIAALNNRAAVYTDQGQLDKGLADCQHALTIHTGHAEAWNTQGVILYKQTAYDQALQSFNQALRLKPRFAKALSNRGNVFAKRQQFQKAFRDFDQALLHQPNYASAYYNRGNAHAKRGRHKQAIRDYNRALRHNPALSLAFVNRALNHAHLGNAASAQKDLRAAVQLNPGLDAHVISIRDRYDL